MATKLEKGTYPVGHGPDDFKAFGPAATRDGEFENTLICDMGCFTQDGKDSNKYYMGMVTQSKKDSKWYTYFEWGRTGATKPQFQMIECSSKQEAEREYADQLHEKNDKRGQWTNHASLGRILQAKPGKDCYLVRPQATRSTGLPDAKTITQNEGAKQVSKPAAGAKKSSTYDPQTQTLLRDLAGGTVSYTRATLSAGAALPTQKAIDDGKVLLIDAQKRVLAVGDNIKDQLADKDLLDITSQLYGRIPKAKARNAGPETWILTKDNIALWGQDLDAFESALYSTDLGDTVNDSFDPFAGAPTRIKLAYLDRKSDAGQFIANWMPDATRKRHHYGRMSVKNMWVVEREVDEKNLLSAQEDILKDNPKIDERPLHQPKERTDIDKDSLKRNVLTNTSLLFHGTRTVNVPGIIRENLRLPKQLVGVVITGAMFGPGIYFADDWMKSAGYTSLDNSYWSSGSGSVKGRDAFMFVAEVALGKMHLADGPRGYTSPPKGTHSVFGKGGYSQVQNNEFIVFTTKQYKLRYLVEFNTGR
jgi:hypothetical protein